MRFHLSIRVAALLLCGALTACATPFSADVARFHSGYQAERQRVAIRSADPALANSLEFATYSAQVAAALTRLGYMVAQPTEPAALIAEVSYVVAPRPALVDGRRGSGVSVGAGVGGGSRSGVGGGVGVGIDLGALLRGKEDPASIADYSLSVRLLPASGGAAVWEGRATTVADSARDGGATAVIPKLTTALFDGFPGPSGKTVHYRASGKQSG